MLKQKQQCHCGRPVEATAEQVYWNKWYGYHGYWKGICPAGHSFISRTGAIYALNHPEDLVQPGDPRFAKLYPKQYQEMQTGQERYQAETKAKEEAEWKADREVVEKFGAQGKDALKAVKERLNEI